MSNGTLEIIKKYIVDNLNASLTPVTADPDVEAFRVQMSDSVIAIHISRFLVTALENSGQIDEYLERINISSFVKNHPGCSLLLFDKGIEIRTKNGHGDAL